jgi:hypothetical protein
VEALGRQLKQAAWGQGHGAAERAGAGLPRVR